VSRFMVQVSKTAELGSYQKKLVQGQQGAGPSIGSHLAQISIVDVQEQHPVFAFSMEDQCAV